LQIAVHIFPPVARALARLLGAQARPPYVRRVRDLLEDARRSYEFVMYPDLPHGWLNDTMPGRFRAEQARETFELIVTWLRATASAKQGTSVSWRFTSTIAEDYDFASNARLH